MSDRRHTLTRKQSIDIDVQGTGEKITISPLPWRKRNDLGNLISTEFADVLERMRNERGLSDISAHYNYGPVLIMGAGLSEEQIDNLTLEEVIAVCHWICDANGLESVLWMLDPEVEPPQISPQETSGGADDGQKTPSTDGSSSQESAQTPLKN